MVAPFEEMTPSALAGPGVSSPTARTAARWHAGDLEHVVERLAPCASTAISGPSVTRLGISTSRSTQEASGGVEHGGVVAGAAVVEPDDDPRGSGHGASLPRRTPAWEGRPRADDSCPECGIWGEPGAPPARPCLVLLPTTTGETEPDDSTVLRTAPLDPAGHRRRRPARHRCPARGRHDQRRRHVGTDLAHRFVDDRARLRPTPSATGTPVPVTCLELIPTILGTPGDDTIEGTAGNDVIVGLGGADTINGLAGDDVICAGDNSLQRTGADPAREDGFDVVHGGDGNDRIDGQGGIDKLYGDAGDDLLLGGDNVGVPADDPLTAGTEEFLQGGVGNDTLRGGSGLNTLWGSYGDDTLLGGADMDRLYGREGDDTMAAGPGDDIVRGYTGNDSGTGNRGSDDLRDKLTSLDSDIYYGGYGDDLIKGRGGDDKLVGGPGADQIRGGAGTDTCTSPSGRPNALSC